MHAYSFFIAGILITIQLDTNIYIEELFFPFIYNELLEQVSEVTVVFREQKTKESYIAEVSSDSSLVEITYDPTYADRLINFGNCLWCVPMEKILLAHNRFIFHSSFIRTSFGGLLFSASSGVGKSTQADLWHKYEGAAIINGDRAIIQKEEDGWRAHGSPFAGSSGYYVNESEKVRAIVLLEQAAVNEVIRPRPAECFRKLLLQTSLYHLDADEVDRLCNLLMELIADVPVYILRCTPDVRAVEALKEALEKGE